MKAPGANEEKMWATPRTMFGPAAGAEKCGPTYWKRRLGAPAESGSTANPPCDVRVETPPDQPPGAGPTDVVNSLTMLQLAEGVAPAVKLAVGAIRPPTSKKVKSELYAPPEVPAGSMLSPAVRLMV